MKCPNCNFNFNTEYIIDNLSNDIILTFLKNDNKVAIFIDLYLFTKRNSSIESVHLYLIRKFGVTIMRIINSWVSKHLIEIHKNLKGRKMYLITGLGEAIYIKLKDLNLI
jgi:hypothetical protein